MNIIRTAVAAASLTAGFALLPTAAYAAPPTAAPNTIQIADCATDPVNSLRITYTVPDSWGGTFTECYEGTGTIDKPVPGPVTHLCAGNYNGTYTDISHNGTQRTFTRTNCYDLPNSIIGNLQVTN
ncbi:hypothetical protein [Nocardia terpenica]|uniref:Uncharacterized protein n=1 Tax=Nocardia terpenica TaxID=455432 RepID=A0A291RC25_9NOCA|nr:hypothetical protein [Nocardia terpenica]ATL65026.1 hypothetical protein CRH09_01025 [Nocardia terpenica]